MTFGQKYKNILKYTGLYQIYKLKKFVKDFNVNDIKEVLFALLCWWSS